MATTTVINGIECRVNETPNGTIYSKNFRSLKEEAMAVGSTEAEVNEKRHAFFLGGNAYYVGPSLQGLSAEELAAQAKDITVCDSSIDGSHWVSTLFKANGVTRISLQF